MDLELIAVLLLGVWALWSVRHRRAAYGLLKQVRMRHVVMAVTLFAVAGTVTLALLASGWSWTTGSWFGLAHGADVWLRPGGISTDFKVISAVGFVAATIVAVPVIQRRERKLRQPSKRESQWVDRALSVGLLWVIFGMPLAAALGFSVASAGLTWIHRRALLQADPAKAQGYALTEVTIVHTLVLVLVAGVTTILPLY